MAQDDPTLVQYPLDWGVDSTELRDPRPAFEKVGFPAGVPLPAGGLGWILRHIYYLLGELYGGTTSERKVVFWPGYMPWVPFGPDEDLNPPADGLDTFIQLLSSGHGVPNTPAPSASVDMFSQMVIYTGDTGAGAGGTSSVNASALLPDAMAGGQVTGVRVRLGSLDTLAGYILWVYMMGSDGLIRLWGLSFLAGDTLTADAWNVLTNLSMDDAGTGASADTDIPGPISVLVRVSAQEPLADIGTERVLMEVEEIEVTFG